MRSPRTAGFTLLEIVIVLTIVSVLIGMAVPAIGSINREREAREPLSRIVALVQQARYFAMRNKQPYQIIFSHDTIRASRFVSPYLDEERGYLLPNDSFGQTEDAQGDLFDEEEASPSGGIVDPEFEDIPLSEDLQCAILRPGLGEWIPLTEDEAEVQLVFQPTGLCEPVTVKISKEEMWITVRFNALTGIVEDERYTIP